MQLLTCPSRVNMLTGWQLTISLKHSRISSPFSCRITTFTVPPNFKNILWNNNETLSLERVLQAPSLLLLFLFYTRGNICVFHCRHFWKSAPGHSCDDSCRSGMLCRLMTGRSHDNSACTLMQETFSEEKRHQLEESLDMC